MFKKTKVIKKSNRGITFSDSEMFPVQSKYQYFIDKINKKVIIYLLMDNQGNSFDIEEKIADISDGHLQTFKGTVSRKKRNNKDYVPLVDIRNSEALQQFNNCDQLKISIGDDIIVVEGITENDDTETYVFDKNQLFKHLNIVAEDAKSHIKIASYFAGAGLLDQGFKEAGFEIVFALEKDKAAAETYRANHGNHILVEDITQFDASVLEGIEVAIAGPPCQGLSPVNRKTNIKNRNWLDNPNNILIKSYLEKLKQMPDLKVFILENSSRLLNFGDGIIVKEICEELPEFEFTYGILNSADFMSPQDRKRTIVIGSKIGKIDLPTPIVSPDNYKTVGEALEGITEDLPNQNDISISKPATKERMCFVPKGGNWRDIPKKLLPKNFGDNTHSSIYRRLELDKPSIAITNVRKSNILHPLFDRILSIREVARLFDLKDDFVFKGSLSAMQQQAANGVTVNMARAIGNKIFETFEKVKYKLKESVGANIISDLQASYLGR